MEPELVYVDGAAVSVIVRPAASALVLLILPLWADTRLEKVVVALWGKLGGLCDVVVYPEECQQKGQQRGKRGKKTGKIRETGE